MHGEPSTLLTSVLLLLGTSTLLITLFYRLRITSLLAFILTGILFGPTGLALIADPAELTAIAELGLTFLLFILGLEFSLPRVFVLRNTVFSLGSMQVVVCAAFFFLVLSLFGLPWQIADILAGMTLAQGSEFMFALLALAARNVLINEEAASNLITIVIISMVLTPLMICHGSRLVNSAYLRIGNKSLQKSEEKTTVIDIQKKNHILILGFGRVGQTIARFLRPLNIDYVVLEIGESYVLQG